VTVQVVAPVVLQLLLPVATKYPVIGELPVLVGAVQLTVAAPLPGWAPTPVGAPGLRLAAPAFPSVPTRVATATTAIQAVTTAPREPRRMDYVPFHFVHRVVRFRPLLLLTPTDENNNVKRASSG
jgi:hypothetical protein